MAGGSGTRFWPMSRASRPKQLLPLLGAQPLVRETIERLSPLLPPERVFIITGEAQADAVAKAAEILPPENIISEPVGRDTAPCVGLAATFLEWRDPGSIFCCLPADHFIGDIGRFHAALEHSRDLAAGDKLVTLGVPPTRPETGYGYIQADGERVVSFHEKPDEAKAREFMAAGDYFWNSGIFVWKSATILKEIGAHLPEHGARLKTIGEALGTNSLPDVLAREFGKMTRISIDYGVMEKAKSVAMVRADFGWDDLGSWISAASYREKDGDGNVVEGSTAAVDTKDSIIFSEDNHLVATLGVEDLVVVHTKDATLICPKDRAADLKKLIEAMRARGLERYL